MNRPEIHCQSGLPGGTMGSTLSFGTTEMTLTSKDEKQMMLKRIQNNRLNQSNIITKRKTKKSKKSKFQLSSKNASAFLNQDLQENLDFTKMTTTMKRILPGNDDDVDYINYKMEKDSLESKEKTNFETSTQATFNIENWVQQILKQFNSTNSTKKISVKSNNTNDNGKGFEALLLWIKQIV